MSSGTPLWGADRRGFGPDPGCLIVVVLLGVVSVALLPLWVRATENRYQPVTAEILTTAGAALERYFDENGRYPRAVSLAELSDSLGTELRGSDRWPFPLKYECWSASPADSVCTAYALGSAGGDQSWERASLREYGTPVEPLSPRDDMVYRNGAFVQRPPAWDTSGAAMWFRIGVAVLAGGLLLPMLFQVVFGAFPGEFVREMIHRMR